MSRIITFSPFISFSVLFLGIEYKHIHIILFGIILVILSMLMVLCACGSELRDEIERANN